MSEESTNLSLWIKLAWRVLNGSLLLLIGAWAIVLAIIVGIYYIPGEASIYLIFFTAPLWFALMMLIAQQAHQQQPISFTLIKSLVLTRLHHLLIITVIGNFFIVVIMLVTLLTSSYIKYLSGHTITGKYIYYAMALNAAFSFSMCFFFLIMGYASRLATLDKMNGLKAYFRALAAAFKNFPKVFAMMIFVGLISAIAASPILLEFFVGPIPMALVSASIGGSVVSLFGILLIYFSSSSIFNQPPLMPEQATQPEEQTPALSEPSPTTESNPEAKP